MERHIFSHAAVVLQPHGTTAMPEMADAEKKEKYNAPAVNSECWQITKRKNRLVWGKSSASITPRLPLHFTARHFSSHREIFRPITASESWDSLRNTQTGGNASKHDFQIKNVRWKKKAEACTSSETCDTDSSTVYLSSSLHGEGEAGYINTIPHPDYI